MTLEKSLEQVVRVLELKRKVDEAVRILIADIDPPDPMAAPSEHRQLS
jgi:hypothetical protein